MKTSWERAAEKREAKLEVVREQVASGSLVIRQMTDEERRQYPPAPPRPESRARRRPYPGPRRPAPETPQDAHDTVGTDDGTIERDPQAE